MGLGFLYFGFFYAKTEPAKKREKKIENLLSQRLIQRGGGGGNLVRSRAKSTRNEIGRGLKGKKASEASRKKGPSPLPLKRFRKGSKKTILIGFPTNSGEPGYGQTQPAIREKISRGLGFFFSAGMFMCIYI